MESTIIWRTLRTLPHPCGADRHRRAIETLHMGMWPGPFLLPLFIVIACMMTTPVAALEPLILDESIRSISIDGHIEIMEDPGETLSPDDVLSGTDAGRFIQVPRDIPYFSSDSVACWARFRLSNPLGRPRELVLEIDFAPLELVELYTPGSDGTHTVMRAGYHIPFTEQPLHHIRPAFPLELGPGEDTTFHLRVRGRDWRLFPGIIHSRADFHRKSIITFALLGMYYGGMVILFLILLLLVYKLREAATFYLSMFVLSFMLLLSTVDGTTSLLYCIIPYERIIAMYMPAVLVENILFILFTRSYLNTKQHVPRFDRALLLAAAASMLAFPIFEFTHVFALPRILMIVSATVGISAGVVLHLSGVPRTRYYLLALLPVCGSSMLLMLRDLTIIEEAFFIRASLYISTLCMSFILSSSFADRLRSVTRSYEETMGDLTRLTVMLHNSLLNKLETAGNYLRAQIDSGDLLPEKLAYTQRLLAHCSSEGRNILFTLKNTGCSAERLAQELRFRGEMTLYLREVSFSLVADLESPQERLDPDSVYCVMAVYGELINNVMKHANARVIEVTLVCREGRLTLSVWDDGTGFEYDPRKNAGESYGFKLISEIARASGAVFDVFSSPGRNTLAMISLRPHRPLSPRR